MEVLENEHENQILENNQTKKSIVGSLVLLVLNIILVAAIVINYLKSNSSIRLSDFQGIHINFLHIISCCCLLLSLLVLESYRYYRLIYSFTNIRNFKLSYLIHSYGKYYDYVTPFGSGGQPFQMYYLHKNNIKSDTAVSVPVCRFLFNHMGLLSFFLFSLIYSLITRNINFDFVFYAGIATFVGNVLFLLAIFFISYKKNISYKICAFFIDVGFKLHLVKEKEDKLNKINLVLDNYQKNVKLINSNKKEFIIQYFLGLVCVILNYVFVYFIYLMFKENINVNVTFLDIITSMVICEMIASVMPLPGGTGAAEFSFISLFTAWFTFANGKNIVVWVMLIWRFFTYYFYVIQGFFMVAKDTFIAFRKRGK